MSTWKKGRRMNDREKRIAALDERWRDWTWIVQDEQGNEIARGNPSEVLGSLLPTDTARKYHLVWERK